MATARPPPDWRLLLFEAGALALVAVARIAALLTFRATPAARHPMVDAYTYWDQANQLLAGRDPFSEGFYQPPAYPWLLATAGRLFGGLDLDAVRWAQLLLGVLTAALVGRIARAIGPSWAAPVAILVYGLYPSTLLFEQDVLTPALTNAALAGALWLSLEGGKAGLPRLALAGLLCGLAVAVHPTLLLAGLVLLGALLVERAPAPRVLAFGLGLALPLVPTTWENLSRFHSFTPVSHNAGINLFLGNNPDWRTTTFLTPGLPFRQLALQADPDARDVHQRDLYWRGQVWAELALHPGAMILALGGKALWSVSNVEIPRNEDYRCRMAVGEPLGWLRFLPIRYGLCFPLAVAGAAVALQRRGRRRLAAVWVALALPMVLFLVADRYRVATWPMVAVLVPMGLAALPRLWANRRGALLWLAGAALLPWIPLDPITDADPARCAYQEAHVAMMEDQPGRARAGYQAVLVARPLDMSAHYWLAQLAARDGDPASASQHMAVVLEQFPDYFPALKDMAAYRSKLGDLDGEITWLDRAWRVPGDRRPTGAALVRALVKADRWEEARAVIVADPGILLHRSLRDLRDQLSKPAGAQ